jgi:hypothetical protein
MFLAPQPDGWPRPPTTEVLAMWQAARPPVLAGCRGAAEYLHRRGLLGGGDYVRVLPADYRCPSWARYGRRSWVQTGHRLIVPVYDHAGRLRLVRGWRWQDDDSPKRLAAAGCSVKGLVMTAGRGLALLLDRLPTWIHLLRLLIVEGEPDFLAAVRAWADWCVLGIVSGSWTDELAQRVPAGTRVLIRTDADAAGDKYARRIAETLRHCREVDRWIP